MVDDLVSCLPQFGAFLPQTVAQPSQNFQIEAVVDRLTRRNTFRVQSRSHTKEIYDNCFHVGLRSPCSFGSSPTLSPRHSSRLQESINGPTAVIKNSLTNSCRCFLYSALRKTPDLVASSVRGTDRVLILTSFAGSGVPLVPWSSADIFPSVLSVDSRGAIGKCNSAFSFDGVPACSPPLSATISTRYGFGVACPGLMTSAFSPPAFSTSVSSTSVSSVLESGVLKIIRGSASSSVLMDSSSSSSTLSTSARFEASCSSRGRFSEGLDNVLELSKPSSALALMDIAGGGLLDSEEDV
ncbi:unnamed protein product [Ixodes persulcatus]